MKKRSTYLVDEHLESFSSLQEATTDEFFYTRLKAKMENREHQKTGSGLVLRPAWAIGVLVILLGLNGYMLSQQSKNKMGNDQSTSLQSFAQSYDQTITSY